MKKLNVDYKIVDEDKTVLKTGNFDYMLSHYIYTLFEQSINEFDKESFWDDFKNVLKKQGLIYLAFQIGDFSILTPKQKITSIRLLHSIGFLIFDNEISSPCYFEKRKKSIIVTDNTQSSIMTFHYKEPVDFNIEGFINHLSAYIIQSASNRFVDDDHINIIVMTSENRVHKFSNEKTKYSFQKEHITGDKFSKVFDIVAGGVAVTINIANYETKIYKNSKDHFSDGTFYYSVEFARKLSHYNLFLDDNNLVFNLLSLSCIKLTTDKFLSLKNGDLKEFNDDEIAQLYKMSFIHSLKNEKNFYARINNNHSKRQNELGISILTTTACNARCHYCFEKGITPVNMNDSTISDLNQFIKQKNVTKINVTWFGGEPLVNSKVICSLSQFCRDNKIDYMSTMISNGYLIDKYIDLIKNEWNVKRIQITLDGLEEEYNNVKKYIYQDPNPFDRIISNIQLLLDREIGVTIRLNFNQSNYCQILECIDYIYEKYGNHKKLFVYASHIFGCGDAIHLKDGTNLYLVIYKKLMEKGYVKSLDDLRIIFNNTGYCFTTNKNHFVVNSDGNLYTCDHAVVDKANGCIGTLKDGITNMDNYRFWTKKYYPLKECNNCQYLFMCNGGCRYENNFDFMAKSPCVWTKEILPELLILLINNKL